MLGLHPLHHLRMASPHGLLFGGLPIKFGMPAETFLSGGLVLFDDQRMGLGVGILTDGGDLPGDFDVRGVGVRRGRGDADLDCSGCDRYAARLAGSRSAGPDGAR